MKKLFFVSGIVCSVTCPAFADVDIASNASSANCNENVLETYNGPSSFGSVWRPAISGAIALDSKRYLDNNGNSVQNPTAAAQPTPLYSIYGRGVYSSQPTTQTMDNGNFDQEDRLTGLSPKPTMAGYTFVGFYTTKASGGTQVIDANGNFIYTGASNANNQISSDGTSVTWYARWEPNTITLVWDSDGGTAQNDGTYVAGTGTDECTYDSDIVLPAVPKKNGYKFIGWDVVN